jgi:hypothetical protein
MKDKFTIQEIKNYIMSQDSLGDVMYNLNAEKIIEANHVDTLESLKDAIVGYFSFDDVKVIDGEIVIEESWSGDCKNDEDCSDAAVENGNMVVEEFPGLEVVECECHRHKYSITTLKLKE